ncbi:uncharacterized protein LOC116340380 [Contarinia nasturtii]|uniref:uncharacterized protein LOC116340380 n=1 Tax=Contarinia nasturtii TaxID=265458 RepID=UPI0012D3FDC2|nr:uncharacterized protein LOC116340380 [Contarinia nasturtii]
MQSEKYPTYFGSKAKLATQPAEVKSVEGQSNINKPIDIKETDQKQVKASFIVPPAPDDVLTINEDIYLSEIDESPAIASAIVKVTDKKDLFPNPPTRVKTTVFDESDFLDSKPSRRAPHPSIRRGEGQLSHPKPNKSQRQIKKSKVTSINKGRSIISVEKPVKRSFFNRPSSQGPKKPIERKKPTKVEEYQPQPLSSYRIPKVVRTPTEPFKIDSKVNPNLVVQIANERSRVSEPNPAVPIKERVALPVPEPTYEQLRAAFDSKKAKLRRKNKNRRERAKRDRNLLNHILETNIVQFGDKNPIVSNE